MVAAPAVSHHRRRHGGSDGAAGLAVLRQVGGFVCRGDFFAVSIAGIMAAPRHPNGHAAGHVGDRRPASAWARGYLSWAQRDTVRSTGFGRVFVRVEQQHRCSRPSSLAPYPCRYDVISAWPLGCLTKGPVAILLPVMIIGLYMLFIPAVTADPAGDLVAQAAAWRPDRRSGLWELGRVHDLALPGVPTRVLLPAEPRPLRRQRHGAGNALVHHSGGLSRRADAVGIADGGGDMGSQTALRHAAGGEAAVDLGPDRAGVLHVLQGAAAKLRAARVSLDLRLAGRVPGGGGRAPSDPSCGSLLSART